MPLKETMKLFAQLLTLGLVGQGVVASNWFSKSSKFDQNHFLFQKEIYPSFCEHWDAKASPLKLSDSCYEQRRLLSCVVIDFLQHQQYNHRQKYTAGSRSLTGSIVYNKWHETELERWLSDHDIPHPSPADRADLEKLVQENWNSKVVSPYSDWDTTQLKAYLAERSQEASNAAGASKDSLLDTVKNYWYETEDKAEEAFSNVKDWIFDRYVWYQP